MVKLEEDAEFVALDIGGYSQALKLVKAHERSIVGVELLHDHRTGQSYCVTFAHDSIKLWLLGSRVADQPEFVELAPGISHWLCSIQSYDIKVVGHGRDRKVLIVVVGVDSTLHRLSISFPFKTAEQPVLEDFNLGPIEIWFGRISPDGGAILTGRDDLAALSGSLQLLGQECEVLQSAPVDKIKRISAMIYGEQFIALGFTNGAISIVNLHTLATLHTMDDHRAMRIRCLAFLAQDSGMEPQLLSGSDDKTIALHAVTDKGAGLSLIRTFCGHLGAVMTVRVDDSSAGERFASTGVDGRLIIWNVRSGEKLHIFRDAERDFFRTICFSADGCYLAAGSDKANVVLFRVPQSENYVKEMGSDWEEEEEEGSDGQASGVTPAMGEPVEVSMEEPNNPEEEMKEDQDHEGTERFEEDETLHHNNTHMETNHESFNDTGVDEDRMVVEEETRTQSQQHLPHQGEVAEVGVDREKEDEDRLELEAQLGID